MFLNKIHLHGFFDVINVYNFHRGNMPSHTERINSELVLNLNISGTPHLSERFSVDLHE